MARKSRKGKAGSKAARAHGPQDRSASSSPQTASSTSEVATASAGSGAAGSAALTGSVVLPAGLRWFAVAFVVFQLVVPAAYYLGEGGYDERFRWRMFSTLRMHTCQLALHDLLGDEQQQRPIQSREVMHVAWFNLLKRHRLPVVYKFLKARCDQEGVSGARYERRCVDTDDSVLPPQTVQLDCESGQYTEEGPP